MKTLINKTNSTKQQEKNFIIFLIVVTIIISLFIIYAPVM